MSTDALLTCLWEAEVHIRLTPEGLRVTNASRLTDDLRRNLRGHKDEIINEMSRPLTERVLSVFGGTEIDVNGRAIKAKSGVLLDVHHAGEFQGGAA